MKKLTLLSGFVLLLLAASSCQKEQSGGGDVPVPPTPTPEVDTLGMITDSLTIAKCWNSKFADETVSSTDSIISMNYFFNGEYLGEYVPEGVVNDVCFEFFAKNHLRFVSRGEGYAISLPLELDPQPDYTLAKYGMKFNLAGSRLRITREKIRSYSQSASGYKAYMEHWLIKYFSKQWYLSKNKLTYYEDVIEKDTSIIEGYETSIYSIEVQNPVNFEFPYYKIAIIRELDQYAYFGFIVFKSAEPMSETFESILKSYGDFSCKGTPMNYMEQQIPAPEPKWNAETAALYDKIVNQHTTGWGVFSASMVSEFNTEYEDNYNTIESEKARLQGPEGWNYQYKIMPTYCPISWYGRKYTFPLTMANTFAGGTGFNDKPVLQFTLGFTTDNNSVGTGNCPLFNVIRGKHDEYFLEMAELIKAYGKPMLLRLNNEMNSDWTSYCGLLSLCDPELFQQGWRHLYDLFMEAGVDNCIWIFNPNDGTAPACYWGEDIAYYPGNEYVQMLGLTSYEFNNGTNPESFESLYSDLWKKNKLFFSQMPSIISEFACGSGGSGSGELMRNQASQAQWVREMFEEFRERPEYVDNIKGAIWFSVDDDNGESITNCLKLYPELTETLQAFRDGFAQLEN